ncbi:CLUMA_CG003681, isoform A [Clunio marinus]|uniref:CLUMA_CG003681, isoform A n=1 Tax=Clunio marinus TaxID=568069 RepID=A0A1J1HUW6_9DIPT|nr:CLUMA_CG003681, isoform A [Clunio marinus]
MKNIFLLLLILYKTLAKEIDLNEICRGIFFEAVSNPNNSNQFFTCVQGKGTIVDCSQEDEIFDPLLVACVPPPPTPEVLCYEKGFGWFPHNDDCTLYIVCEFSRPIIRRCPVNTLFNPSLPGCASGNVETCTLDDIPIVTTTIRTTTISSNDINVSFVCPSSGSGNIPYKNDCSRYYECVLGIRNPRTCSDGEIFDVVTGRCDDPDISLCAENIRCT